MLNKTKTNLLVDIVIFAAFLVASQPSLTGLAVHEWFAVSFSAVILTHLLLHWDWIAAITKNFFRKLFHESRFNYVLNALLFAAMTAAFLSGLMISRNVLPSLGLAINASRGWREIHSLSANLSLFLVGLHFAMHWKWVVTNMKRYIVEPVTSLGRRPVVCPVPAQFVPQPVRVDSNKK